VLSGPFGLPAAVRAADNEPILAQKAHDILKANCYRCHGQDGAIEGGLNYILDFKTLVARKKVIPGDPAKSRLMKRLRSEDNPMPPAEEKVRPSKDEIATLERWIKAGAPELAAAPATRSFLTDADVLRYIADDLDTLDERHRPYARYFTISHLYNTGLSDDELQTYRHGLAKLVNSLSWEPDIVAPKAIDPAQTILRIDLRAYRWGADIWTRILDLYPYSVLYPTATARAVYSATNCELPYVRADWFVFAASRPPLYHDILGLPKTDRELETELRVDVAANIREERVARAGFNGSGVSRNNRLIERHKTGYGAYWKSYDFAGNVNRQNLFAHPLGPGTDTRRFQQDGGEIIFNLPNGLQAYMLVDGRGNRIDEGPTKIVSVKNKPDPTVINGVSCMFCHARGLIDKGDQIRAHVEKNPDAFDEADAQVIRALYPPEAEFRALLHKDADRFQRAVAATGTRLGQTEPVVALAGRFEAELDLTAAAAEFGLRPGPLLRGLDRAQDFTQRLGALKVEGGTVQRQVFVECFAGLVQEFRLGESLASLNKTIATSTETIQSNPKNASAHVERGNARFSKGVFDKAISDYDEAIRLGFRGSDVYQARGMAHANRGDYHRAIVDYDEALRLDPTHADTYHNRGLAHAKREDYRLALADLSKVIELDPRNAAGYSDRGFIYATQGSFDEAVADYSRALQIQPRAAAVYVRRGNTFASKGAGEQAVADYSRALEINPRFAAAYQGRAEQYVQQGLYEKAVADFREALRLDRRSAVAHNSLAWLRATCPDALYRDGKEAVEHATRACVLAGWKEAEYLDTLAAAYAESGQLDEAIRWAQKALDLAPEASRAEFRQRLALYQTGKAYRQAKH
jgi:tetratricopeptide (TPR) repeat protein